jgi:hypothetical protein
MGRTKGLLTAILGLLLLAVFVYGMVELFRPMSATQSGQGYPEPGMTVGANTLPVATAQPRAGTAYPGPATPLPALTATPIGYPGPATPGPTVPGPTLTAYAMTAQVDATEDAGPTPTIDPGYVWGPQVVQDDAANFRITIPEGWMARARRAITIYNYDSTLRGGEGDFQPGEVKVTIDYDELEPNETFEQWLETTIAEQTDTSVDPYAPPISATEPQPKMLGANEGVSYVLTSGLAQTSTIVYMLPTDDGRVIMVGMGPAESTAAPLAIEVLSTLEILPK